MYVPCPGFRPPLQIKLKCKILKIGEMAQSVKCLLHKHKSVNFNFQNPNKKPLQQILAKAG